MLEQALSGLDTPAGSLREGFGEFAHRVQCEGEQVEEDEHIGESLLAVAEDVFEVVAVLLEHVEGPGPDLPSGAGAVDEFHDVVTMDVEAGDEGAVASDRAVRPPAGDLQPVDPQGVVAVPQGQVRYPPVAVDAPPGPGSGSGLAGMGMDAVEGLVEGLVTGPGGEQEVAPVVGHHPTDGLASVQVVAVKSVGSEPAYGVARPSRDASSRCL